MKKLIVTGAENSGTGLVSKLLRASGAEVIHRAIPHVDAEGTYWEPLFDLEDKTCDGIIFVARHFPAQKASQLANSGRASTIMGALDHVTYFTEIYAIPLYVWTYEAIVHEWPQAFVEAASQLGLNDFEDALQISVTDENSKHYSVYGGRGNPVEETQDC